MRVTVLAVVLGAAAGPLHAQASRYLPLDDWATPLVEHLIRSRVIEDPNPLTRPLTEAQVVRALEQADTTALPAAVRATVRRLLARFERGSPEPSYRVEIFVGAAGATHDRRELLREAGDEWIAANGGARLSASLGPLVLSAVPYVDTHLTQDPDWPGDSVASAISGRFTNAYLAVQTRYADLFFGSLARNWGTPGIDGLLLSGYPYTYDHLAVRLGTRHVRIETMLTQLDDGLAADSAVINRFYVAHRVSVRPIRQVLFAIGQSTLWRGAGRTWELRWLNPFKLSRQTAIDEGIPDSANSAYLGDLRVELPGGAVFGAQFLMDDWSARQNPPFPDRFAGTASLDLPLGPAVALRALYTAVSSLTYKTAQGRDFSLVRSGIGLGRNHSDYSQATLSASVVAAPAVLLEPEITWLRQGESELTQPFPPLPAPDYPFLFVGTVETTWRLALGGRADLIHGVEVSANAGVHFVRNAGHVAGASRTPFVGAVALTWRLGRRFPG
jgi:hypothetical protein